MDNNVLTSFSKEEQSIIDASGYGSYLGPKSKAALVVIDVTYAFTGDNPGDSLTDSLAKWPLSCGPSAWKAIPKIQSLITAAREARVPIYFTKMVERKSDGTGTCEWRNSRIRDFVGAPGFDPREFVKEVSPASEDTVITKIAPSAFYGTALDAYLNQLDIDSVFLCGTTTSGCVRATAVDGFSRNIRSIVIEDASFDRIQTSHNVALFDLNAKYADVVSSAEAIELFAGRGQ